MINVTHRNSTEFSKNCQYVKNNKSKNFLQKIQNVENLLKKENKLTNEHKRDLKNYAQKLKIEKQKNDLLDIYLLSKKQKRILKNFAGESWISLYRKVRYKTLILLTVIIQQLRAMNAITHGEYCRSLLIERLKKIYPHKDKNFWYRIDEIINVHLLQKGVLKLAKHQKHNNPYCKDFLAISTNSGQQSRVIPNLHSRSSNYSKQETNNKNRCLHIYADILKKNTSDDIITKTKQEKQEREKRFLEAKERFLNLSIDKYKERKSRGEQAIIYHNEFEGRFRQCFSIRNEFRSVIEYISTSSLVSEFYYDQNPRKYAKFRTTADRKYLNSYEIKVIAEEYSLKKIKIEPMLKRSANKLFYVGHPLLTKIIRDFYYEFGKISWDNRNMPKDQIKKLEVNLEFLLNHLYDIWNEENEFIKKTHPTRVVKAWKIRIANLKRKLKPEETLPEHVKESLKEQEINIEVQELARKEQERKEKLNNQKKALSLEWQNRIFSDIFRRIVVITGHGAEYFTRVGISQKDDIIGLLENKDPEIMKVWLNESVKKNFSDVVGSLGIEIIEDILKNFDVNIFVERFKTVLKKRISANYANYEEKEAAEVLKVICPLLGID